MKPARQRWNAIVNSTKQVFQREEPEPNEQETHESGLRDFASNPAGRDEFLEDLDRRIEAADSLMLQARDSHADLCTYMGGKTALKALKDDFLKWMEK